MKQSALTTEGPWWPEEPPGGGLSLRVAYEAVNRIVSASMLLAPLAAEPGTVGAQVRETIADLDWATVDVRSAVFEVVEPGLDRLQRAGARIQAGASSLEAARTSCVAMEPGQGGMLARLEKAADALRAVTRLLGAGRED